MIQITRCYRIPAAHVLSNPTLADDENDAIFGKCANPNGHGHNYGFEVTVTGPVDASSGQIIATDTLDAIFDDVIRDRYAYHLLNECEAFETLVPTTENFARVAYRDLAPEVGRRSGARLVRVKVIETPRNTFEYGDPQ